MHEIHYDGKDYIPSLKKAAIWAMMHPWEPVVCICTLYGHPTFADYFLSDGYYNRTVQKTKSGPRLHTQAEQQCVADMWLEVDRLAKPAVDTHTCICSECGREMDDA